MSYFESADLMESFDIFLALQHVEDENQQRFRDVVSDTSRESLPDVINQTLEKDLQHKTFQTFLKMKFFWPKLRC